MATRITSQAEPLPGYKLIERLGRGGYGEVWKAEAPGGLFKAIKFVYGDLDSAGDDNKGAEQELKALHRVKSIRHPYILSIERFDIIEGQLMIVMELADRNLWDRFHECRTQGLVGIPREELLGYLDETSEALDLMNASYQIQHLDIKPQNLFLVHNHVKVADFGLAKDFEGIRATVTGGVTPVYAAPETFEGWISRFCDQYSLAIVYQELLTGVRPFSGTNTRHLLLQHLSAVPDVSPLPPAEREIVARSLSKKPDDRFPMCTDFVKALRNAGRAPPTPVSIGPAKLASPPPPDTAQTVPNYKSAKPADPAAREAPANPVHTPSPQPTMRPGVLKGLPKLITPAAAGATPAPPSSGRSGIHPSPIVTPAGNVTQQRPPAHESGRLSRLGIAPPEKLGTGVLLPAYIIGLGRNGLHVLQRLRAYLHERFGRGGFPHWKWLFIDTDSEAIQAATSASKHELFDSNEVYHARLHRPAHYSKRDGLPSPDSWMNNEALYRISREPATEGVRALGRLALLDHYAGISQKIRQDLDTFLSDDALMEADRLTKLGIRSNRPRVFIASSLTGGTGSGMLIDFAYLLRHEMLQAGFLKPHLNGLFLVPPVDRTSPKNIGIANTCVTLAELDHFSRPSNRYEAKFDTRQPTIADPERPFDHAVLLTLPRTPSPQSPPNADRAAGLIYQETLTTVGRLSDEARAVCLGKRPPLGLPLISVGCYRITWPRQRLLDTVSERLAARTVQQWASKDVAPIKVLVAEWVEDQWQKLHLDPTSLASTLEVAMASELDDKPSSLIDIELSQLPIEIGPTNKTEILDVIPAIDRLLHLVGKPGIAEETMPGQFHGVLEKAAKSITKESEIKFAKLAVHFIEQPFYRLAGAEETIALCIERLRKLIDEHDELVRKLAKELEEEYVKLVPLLGSLSTSGMFKTEKRRAHAVQDILNWMRNWPRKRLQYLLAKCQSSIYRQMLGNAPEYIRELALCRQRLGEVAGSLKTLAAASSDLGPSQDHPILPPGCRTLIEAADQLIAEIPEEDMQEFEDSFQQKIRRQLRALINVCLKLAENGPKFKEMLLEHCRMFVDARLGQHTPAEEFFRNRPDAQAAQRELLLAFDEATPEPFGPHPQPEGQSFVLGVSKDEHGKLFLESAKELLPDLPVIDAPATTEIVFYREYHDLQITDLPQTGALAAETVREVKSRDHINPHARTDVAWNSFLRE